jgi:hypothetical protein
MKNNCWTGIFASFVLVFVVGCSSSTSQIVVIIPDDYEGEFSIEKDEKGVDPYFQHGQVVYQIPEVGKMLAKDVSPFFRWHTIVFTNKAGTNVNVKSMGMIAGQRGNESRYDFDGTHFRWQVLK